MRQATIKHVEIDLQANIWEILLNTNLYLDEAELEQAATCIVEEYHLKSVQFYQDIVNFSEVIQEKWPDIVAALHKHNPAVAVVLKNTPISIDGNSISISIAGHLLEDLIQAQHIDTVLEKIIQEICGLECHIEFLIDERGIATNAAPDYYMVDKKVVVGTDHKEQKISTKPAEHKRPPIPQLDIHGTVIFGKNLRGTELDIANIDGEMKNIVISGTLNGIFYREFKTGTHLVTCGIADHTDGIGVKIFIKKEEEFAQIQGLKNGMYVQMSGQVRFDWRQSA